MAAQPPPAQHQNKEDSDALTASPLDGARAETTTERHIAGMAGARRVAPLMRAWWESNRVAVTQAFFLFLSLRIGLSLVALLAVAFLPEQQGLHYTLHPSSNVLLDVWARWDSEHYLNIAQHGYSFRPELTAFFPLYPLLMVIAAPALGSDYVLSGVIVSSVMCFLALVYMFKLAALEFGDEVAGRATLYLAVYPMALFMLAVYAESLFLTVSIAAFYYARRARWGMSALAALLAGLTRPTGLLLVFPLAYEAWRQSRGNLKLLFLTRLLAVAAAPLGWLLWAGYLAWTTGDLLAISHTVDQSPWWRAARWPWETLAIEFGHLGDVAITPLSRIVNSQDLVYAVFLIEASVIAWWALPRIYAIYCTVSTWTLLSFTVVDWPMQSLPRYSLAIFPIFLLLARLGANRHWDRAIVITGATLLGLNTTLFATWYWVF
ncbi:MAG TPA: mannosyltransferase family protein [Chloroflexia bacterium]|nr:mannosyltransferase family protein [Chloroflexia bacterium]